MSKPTPQQTRAGAPAIAALSVDVSASGAPSAAPVQLLPAGTFRAKDGRPAGLPGWRLDDATAVRVLARARARRNRFVIDYEHQTQHAETNGQPAPAAGWFSPEDLEFRPGEGLFVTRVEWTPRAQAFLKNGEYRYLSSVFAFDVKTGQVETLVCAALTNDPALDGLSEVALAALTGRAATLFQAETDTATLPNVGTPPENASMNPVLKALLAALGLAESATETEAVAALTLIKTQAGLVDGLQTQVAALKNATPDAALFVPIDKYNELNTQLVQLKASQDAAEVDALINQAKAAGKLTPAAELVWREVGKSSLASLKALVEKTPGNPALAGQQQTGGNAPAGGQGGGEGAQLDETALAVCKRMGITPEQFKGAAITAA